MKIIICTRDQLEFKRGQKIPNLTCRESLNFEPSLGNRNSMIRPLITMTNFVLVVLLTNDKYGE